MLFYFTYHVFLLLLSCTKLKTNFGLFKEYHKKMSVTLLLSYIGSEDMSNFKYVKPEQASVNNNRNKRKYN